MKCWEIILCLFALEVLRVTCLGGRFRNGNFVGIQVMSFGRGFSQKSHFFRKKFQSILKIRQMKDDPPTHWVQSLTFAIT